MKFYTKQHNYYFGIVLHARHLYVCILNQTGDIVLRKNIKANPQALLDNAAFFRSSRTTAKKIFVSDTMLIWRVVQLHDFLSKG